MPPIDEQDRRRAFETPMPGVTMGGIDGSVAWVIQVESPNAIRVLVQAPPEERVWSRSDYDRWLLGAVELEVPR